MIEPVVPRLRLGGALQDSGQTGGSRSSARVYGLNPMSFSIGRFILSAPVNVFKENLRLGQAQIGLWLGLADAYTTEICAGMGFDWLLVDGEHSPNDIRSVLQQLQAIASYPSHPVVRLPVGETYLIKQAMDIGAQTLLIPMVETADQAKNLVAATHYPPKGIRGVGSALARAAHWGMIQVESRRGLDNLKEIATVPGIDGVFIGPSDLAGALGHLGKPGDRAVVSTIEDAIQCIREAGKAAGILTPDTSLASHYLSLGCTFVAVGTDVALLCRAGHALAEQFKEQHCCKGAS
jgi:4-hydroxy-2-oxoheptanedioate aldolase